nr:carbonic anhydrase 13 isoform X3 [Chrysemys picta bellii]
MGEFLSLQMSIPNTSIEVRDTQDLHLWPARWKEVFPVANGDRQSPIDIQTEETKYDPALPPINPNYDPTSAKVILNNGHSTSVEFDDTENKSVLRGGPLNGSYRLRQIHFHWGASDDIGSEHAVDGKKYAAELHVVHWNSDKYSTFVEAARQRDGLAVMAVFLKIGECNSQLKKITDRLDAIRAKLAKFRSLLCTAEGEAACCMLRNYRPPQPLKGREVRRN